MRSPFVVTKYENGQLAASGYVTFNKAEAEKTASRYRASKDGAEYRVEEMKRDLMEALDHVGFLEE